MLRSTFSRLMAVFIVVILLCVGMLYAVFYITARDAQIDSKVDALKRQAYDIGYLAGSTQAQRMAFTLGNSYPLR
jgi:CHASE3 domain sensor protein